MKPRELTQPQRQTDALSVVLYLDPALFWFQGHFAVQPLLPGIAQLDWVMHYAAHLVPERQFGGIQSVKFQSPLLPENVVTLNLVWCAGKQLLTFSYQRHHDGDARTTASSGKIQLCR